MAKIRLSERKFSLVPEGITTFKVMEVDDEKYEDFGKLLVKLQTAKGETHVEQFTLLKDNDEVNEGALRAWSWFARTCLNNSQADEIDTQDIVGCYITATVKHETYTATKGNNAGREMTNVRLSDYTSASGFGSGSKVQEQGAPVEDNDEIDDFLDD